jgi:predicted dehydrogenase
MFYGPAPEHGYNETLRRQWRYLWRYGGGDMHYDGIHQVDIARWLVGSCLFSRRASYCLVCSVCWFWGLS